jgi:hypothetical protein
VGGHIFLFSQKIIKTGVFFTEEGSKMKKGHKEMSLLFSD